MIQTEHSAQALSCRRFIEQEQMPFLIAILLFIPLAIRVLHLPFYYDDNELFEMNARACDLKGILMSFIPGKGPVFFSHAFYRPITHLSWWLDGILWGDWVMGFRITNLFFYALGIYLIAKIARLMALPELAIALALAFFLFHPLHIEVLAWVAARGDLLALIFMLLGLYSHLRGDRLQQKVFTCFCFLLALLSKESAVVFPAWILVTDLILRKRWKDRHTWLLLAALCGVIAAYFYCRFLFLGGLAGYDRSGSSRHMDLLLSGYENLWDRLVRKPVQALFQPWPELVAEAARFQALRVGFTVSTLAVLVGLLRKQKAALPWLLWALALALGSYLPGSVIDVQPNLLNSRMLYQSSFSICLLWGLAISQLWHWQKPVALTVFLLPFVLSSCLGLMAWEQSGRLLRKLPEETRITYPGLGSGDQLIFVNHDFAFRAQAIAFSNVPAGFTRAFKRAFGPQPPSFDWQHEGATLQMEGLRARKTALGSQLFFAEWDEKNERVKDLTAEIKRNVEALDAVDSEPFLSFSGADLHARLFEKHDLELRVAGDQLEVQAVSTQGWFGFTVPDLAIRRVVVHWGNRDPEWRGPLSAGLLWVTQNQPRWGSLALSQSQPSAAEITSQFDFPVTMLLDVGEGNLVKAMRFDPGRRAGDFKIARIDFYK